MLKHFWKEGRKGGRRGKEWKGSKDALRKGRRQAEEGLDDAGDWVVRTLGYFWRVKMRGLVWCPLQRSNAHSPVLGSQESLVNIVSLGLCWHQQASARLKGWFVLGSSSNLIIIPQEITFFPYLPRMKWLAFHPIDCPQGFVAAFYKNFCCCSHFPQEYCENKWELKSLWTFSKKENF